MSEIVMLVIISVELALVVGLLWRIADKVAPR